MNKAIQWLRKIYLAPFILMMQGGGTSGSDSSSRPLNAAERTEAFQAGLQNIAAASPGMFSRGVTPASGDQYVWVPGTTQSGSGGYNPFSPGGATSQSQSGGSWQANPNYRPATSSLEFKSPEYETPTYQSSGKPLQLTAGDYEKLQADVLKGTTAGLDYAKNIDVRNVNNDAAKRGIWSSGLVMQGEKDVSGAYAPQYEKAGADATTLRYTLQSGENKDLNAFNQTEAAQKNSFNMENANRKYTSAWTPANYLKDLYNGTGGTISSGSSGGWNFNI